MARFSWRPTTAPLMPRPGGRFDDIWFLDAKRGWAVNSAGQILVTRDGGRSWSEQTILSRQIPEMLVFLERTGWMGWHGHRSWATLFNP